MVLTMSEGDQRPECIKDNAATDEPVDVQLAQELHRRDPALIHAIQVRLEPAADILEDLVDDADRERGVVPLQIIREHREHGDVPVLELPRLREHFVECARNDGIRPIELA